MDKILSHISVKRMTDDLWKLVNIPSPTGQERRAALVYADMLRKAGADVELDETLPESPSVIGRLKGNCPGRTIQLAGHIDHIDIPHARPTRTSTIISSRGSADMKNGLAGILEIVRVLKRNGGNFPGHVLVTVYGLHEAPAGKSQGLLRLIQRKTTGHAAIITEGDIQNDRAVIMGKGQSIWNVTITRTGAVCHELNRPPQADDLLNTSQMVIEKLEAYRRQLQSRKNRMCLLSPESLFIGQMHYGDFYNRVPVVCTLQGTRRWHPGRTFPQVQKEMATVIKSVKCPKGISIKNKWDFVGESYTVQPSEMVVQALAAAYRTVTGKSLRYTGTSVVYDAHRLVPLAKVPTVLCGFDNEFSHADHEYVRIKRLLKPCRVVLQTVINYLHQDQKKQCGAS